MLLLGELNPAFTIHRNNRFGQYYYERSPRHRNCFAWGSGCPCRQLLGLSSTTAPVAKNIYGESRDCPKDLPVPVHSHLHQTSITDRRWWPPWGLDVEGRGRSPGKGLDRGKETCGMSDQCWRGQHSLTASLHRFCCNESAGAHKQLVE